MRKWQMGLLAAIAAVVAFGGRAWAMLGLVAALAVLVLAGGPARAAYDVDHDFETYQQLVYEHGQWVWKTYVQSTGLQVFVTEESANAWIPISYAVLDASGNPIEQVVLGEIQYDDSNGTGCVRPNYCDGVGSDVTYCSGGGVWGGECGGSWRCNDGHTVPVSGDCTTHVLEGTVAVCERTRCGCLMDLSMAQIMCEGHQGASTPPSHSPWNPWSDEDASSVFMAPCGANTPVTTSGQCEGVTTPCVNCDPFPANNGGPIPTDPE